MLLRKDEGFSIFDWTCHIGQEIDNWCFLEWSGWAVLKICLFACIFFHFRCYALFILLFLSKFSIFARFRSPTISFLVLVYNWLYQEQTPCVLRIHLHRGKLCYIEDLFPKFWTVSHQNICLLLRHYVRTYCSCLMQFPIFFRCSF